MKTELERFIPPATPGEEKPRATGKLWQVVGGLPLILRQSPGWPLASARIEERRADPCRAQLSPLFEGWEAPRLLLVVRPAPRPTEGRLSDRSLHVCVCGY